MGLWWSRDFCGRSPQGPWWLPEPGGEGALLGLVAAAGLLPNASRHASLWERVSCPYKRSRPRMLGQNPQGVGTGLGSAQQRPEAPQARVSSSTGKADSALSLNYSHRGGDAPPEAGRVEKAHAEHGVCRSDEMGVSSPRAALPAPVPCSSSCKGSEPGTPSSSLSPGPFDQPEAWAGLPGS